MSQKREEALIQAGYRYALALTHGSDEAEDLVHESWVRLRRSGRLWIRKPTLFRTIRNLFVDRYRREQIVPLDVYDETVMALPGESDVEIDATRAELERALGCLRAGEREAIYLQAVEGYTAKEIADLTARPRGTVLSLIHRARQRLKSELDPRRERRGTAAESEEP